MVLMHLFRTAHSSLVIFIQVWAGFLFIFFPSFFNVIVEIKFPPSSGSDCHAPPAFIWSKIIDSVLRRTLLGQRKEGGGGRFLGGHSQPAMGALDRTNFYAESGGQVSSALYVQPAKKQQYRNVMPPSPPSPNPRPCRLLNPGGTAFFETLASWCFWRLPAPISRPCPNPHPWGGGPHLFVTQVGFAQDKGGIFLNLLLHQNSLC